jgi:hypothetical protein
LNPPTNKKSSDIYFDSIMAAYAQTYDMMKISGLTISMVLKPARIALLGALYYIQHGSEPHVSASPLSASGDQVRPSGVLARAK